MASSAALLPESEERFRAIFDAVNDAIFVHDCATGEILDVNAKMCAMYGCTREQARELSVAHLSSREPGYDVEEASAWIRRAVDIGPQIFEWHARRCDGTLFWAEVSLRKASLGPQPVLLALVRDIGERRRAEARLREAHRLFLDIVEFLPDATFVIDRDKKVIAWNRALEQMTGVSKNEMLGKGDHAYALPFYGKRRPIAVDLITAPDPETEGRYESVQRCGDTLYAEVFVPSLYGGRGAFVQATASPLRGADGEVCGAIESVRDVSERRRMENELRRYQGHLEELVATRTAELQAANRELEAFSGSVSHDLRAPLRHIKSYGDLLLKKAGDSLPEEQRHFLGVICRAAGRMDALIEDLLAFSRSRAVELRVERFALGPLVEEARAELEPDLAERKVDWIIGTLPEVSGDRALFRQVLVNLLANALKFTATRERAVVEVSSCGCADGQDAIFVRDNGVGFDMAKVGRLFGPFQRLHSDEAFRGTGLGLANVKRIVERHGGRVWAESSPDKGAAFYFTLPRPPAV